MKKIKRTIFAGIATCIMAAIIYYIFLPAINIRSTDFWVYAIVLVVIFIGNRVIMSIGEDGDGAPPSFRFACIALGILLVIFIGAVIGGSAMFNADNYASQLVMSEGDFATDFPEEENVADVALMDTASARIIGGRTLGTLSDLVSQFKVSESYTQINYKGAPMKIAPLNYAGFFKYMKNDGIPGYTLVDPVANTAEFVRLDEKIQYSKSAFFGKDLYRKLTFDNPTAILGTVRFEIDESGKPYWTCPTLKPNAGLFGAKTIKSVIIMDAVTGESREYEINEVPVWVDYVYSGERISEIYNWYGRYHLGFFNFSQEGCTATTDDYGYKTIGEDVYVITGTTSLTAEDESNIGFIMTNCRTGECRYYPVSGAEEYSAMSAAQGEVQQYKYKASFPSLINVGGSPTYLMVLKDSNHIVKLYAMVNVENYNIVVTGKTQADALSEYRKVMAKTSPMASAAEEIVTATITIASLDFITVDGETFCYIKDGMNCYKIAFEEKLMLLDAGEQATVEYMELEDITELISLVVNP
ncbi:hypothetical protein [Anaerobium acetethylicum]|uniref:CvpA family protein n=1 Tax=Anaerobium acetethylicum TaxID=1619234 RepID=A0A1D3TTC2_9FIRM|nr:hypothetical protein [Anaerobium acetethylicum]SCP97201.1 hypothetical protein SAMN05421730_100926 [Anaerobium acetethylicum]